MHEESWLTLSGSVKPAPRLVGLASQSFEFPHGPSDEMLVDAPGDRKQLGAVEDVTVSRHPAYYSDRDPQGSSPSPGWPKFPFEVRGLRSRAITAPSSLLRRSPPQCAASGTLAFSFSASAYSRSLCHQRGHGTTGSRVPSKSPSPRSRPLYAGHRLARNETTRQANPRVGLRPWF